MSADKEKIPEGISTLDAIEVLRSKVTDRSECMICGVAALLAVELNLLSKKLNVIDEKLNLVICRGDSP